MALAGPALACSCPDPSDLNPTTWQRVVSEARRSFPLIIDGQVIETVWPVQCSVASIRWAYAISGAAAKVGSRIRVAKVLRGTAPSEITIYRTHNVGFGKCYTSGTNCEPAFDTKTGRWALRQLFNGYERANRCQEQAALFGMQST